MAPKATQAADTLGIVAGGGDLPLAVAKAAQSAGRGVFLIGLAGSADARIEAYPHAWAGLGEAGKTLRALKGAGCTDMLMVGHLQRPKFSDLKFDAKGLMVVPRFATAARRGDNALLETLTEVFSEEGFRVLSVAEAAPSLLAPDGPIGRQTPNAEQCADIARGFAIVRALGALDVGQAAVVCEGLPLAVEAAEGTDAMLLRIPALPVHFRGQDKHRRGVLVKALKPIQDGKTDLPVIGLKTLEHAAAAGLAGIALEAGKALILDREALAAEADRLGMFVTGVTP